METAQIRSQHLTLMRKKKNYLSIIIKYPSYSEFSPHLISVMLVYDIIKTRVQVIQEIDNLYWCAHGCNRCKAHYIWEKYCRWFKQLRLYDLSRFQLISTRSIKTGSNLSSGSNPTPDKRRHLPLQRGFLKPRCKGKCRRLSNWSLWIKSSKIYFGTLVCQANEKQWKGV